MLCFLVIKLNAQNSPGFNLWWYYIGKHKINRNINIQSFLLLNIDIQSKKLKQKTIRISGEFNLNENLKLSTGLEFINFLDKKNEHRFHEKISVLGKYKKINSIFSIRFEHRLISKNIRHRIRLGIDAKTLLFAFNNCKCVKLIFNNEFIVNLDETITKSLLSQNRFFIGVEKPFNKFSKIRMGYMNQVIYSSSNKTNHNVVLGVHYNM